MRKHIVSLDGHKEDAKHCFKLYSIKGVLKLFWYNWNNKTNMIQDGILYTSSRLVGTSVEDSVDKQKEKLTFKLKRWATRDEASRIDSQLVWNNREYVRWTLLLFILILIFQLDLNSFSY